MSKRCEKFDPKCPGCRPCILDVKTGMPLNQSDPVMIAVNNVWDSAPYEEQEAFYKVTALNDHSYNNMALVGKLNVKMAIAMEPFNRK